MGKKAALRIADKHGTGYTVGTAFDTVGNVEFHVKFKNFDTS